MIPRITGCLAALIAVGAPGLAFGEMVPDASSIITMQLENDLLVPNSDRYYTNGVRIGYTSPTDQLPSIMADFGHFLLGPGQQRAAIEFSQLLFTPENTGITDPVRTDRPYAAILMGTLSLIQDTEDTRTVLSAGLGVIGPPAFGRQAQNTTHFLIGQPIARGWGAQIPSQPVVQLTAERTWRLKVAEIGGLEADVLPAVTAGAGTFRIYGQAGAQVRVGQGLDSDFGAPRIRSGMAGSDAYNATRPFAWYVFVGGNGQAVAWDETLDGTPFGASRSVTRTPFVGEVQGGVVLMAWGMRVTAAHVMRSKEFVNQKEGLFQFSSLSVAFKF